MLWVVNSIGDVGYGGWLPSLVDEANVHVGQVLLQVVGVLDEARVHLAADDQDGAGDLVHVDLVLPALAHRRAHEELPVLLEVACLISIEI